MYSLLFYFFFPKKQSFQYERPIQMQNGKAERAKDKESQPPRRWEVLDESDNTSMPQFPHL